MITFSEKYNERFKQVYLECLYCRTELIQFNYPYEIEAEDYAIDEHLKHCKQILAEYLYDRIPGIASKQELKLDNAQLNEVVKERLDYVMNLVAPNIGKFVEEVRVIYIN
jgi:hypothetical protein